VTDGARTHNRWIHNPVLCLLSYDHHAPAVRKPRGFHLKSNTAAAEPLVVSTHPDTMGRVRSESLEQMMRRSSRRPASALRFERCSFAGVQLTDIAARSQSGVTTTLSVLVQAMRPKQWLKSGFVAAALVFAGRLTDFGSVTRVAWAMLAFAVIGSAGYLVNDVCDAGRDRTHPVKRSRPVAAGDLAPVRALLYAATLSVCGIAAALVLGPRFVLVALAYLTITVAYSLLLKYLVFVDALAIAAGFVLRALAGAVAINVHMSLWLGLLTALLATYIVLVKRLGEADIIAAPSVPHYPKPVLDASIAVIGLACVSAYTAYTLLAANLPRDHSMVLTIPFVAAGLARYAFLAHRKPGSAEMLIAGAPEEAVLSDLTLAGSVAGWLVITLAVLYWIK
jgi:4-hydroxybenzoate polyprenyltransferase